MILLMLLERMVLKSRCPGEAQAVEQRGQDGRTRKRGELASSARGSGQQICGGSSVVEHLLAKQVAVGSNPILRSNVDKG